MKNDDWLFSDEKRVHNFRSAGVLCVDGKILIQRQIDSKEYSLPGGHVGWGETSGNAVVREYKEELGVDILVDRLIWIEEAFWKWGRRNAHTICHYHLINLVDSSQIPSKGTFKSLETDESRLIFEWVKIEELHNYRIYPVFLKDKITELADGIEHFVTQDIEI